MDSNAIVLCATSQDCIKLKFYNGLIENFLVANDVEVVGLSQMNRAGTLIVNICSFQRMSLEFKFVMSQIKKFKNIGGKVIVVGCVTDYVLEDNPILLDSPVILQHELEKLDEVLTFDIKYSSLPNFLIEDGYITAKKIDEKAQLISVNTNWGCDKRNCSYCNIYFARTGGNVSRPSDKIINDIKQGLNTINDPNNTSINVATLISDENSCYHDKDGGDLISLLERIQTECSEIHKVYIPQLYPSYLEKYKSFFIDCAKDNFLYSLCIPLQHGNKNILIEMNRGNYNPYICAEIMNEMTNIDSSLYTYIYNIYGFQLETFDDLNHHVELSKISKAMAVMFLFVNYRESLGYKLGGEDSIEISERKRFVLKNLMDSNKIELYLMDPGSLLYNKTYSFNEMMDLYESLRNKQDTSIMSTSIGFKKRSQLDYWKT